MIKTVTTAAVVAMLVGSAPASAAPDAGVHGKRAEMLSKRFDKLDTNKDGFVELSDLEKSLMRIFDRADTNKDGAVDAEEIKAISGKRAEQMQKRIMRADANGDGKVTRQEMIAKAPAWFERADADKDGKVSKAEMAAFAEKLRSGKKGDMN